KTPPDHLHDIRRAGDVNSKILLIELVHDPLELTDGLLGVLVFHEHDGVARLAIVRDQEPAPKWARHRVRKILRPIGQTFHRADGTDLLELLRESLQSAEIARRRNV